MPKYRVTDPISGKTVILTGDSPPSPEELEQIFADINREAPAPAPMHPHARVAAGLWDAGVGAAKGLGQSVMGLGQIARSLIPGVAAAGDALAPAGMTGADALSEVHASLEPSGTAQNIGHTIEQLLEFVAPGGVVRGVGRGLVGRMAVEGATSAGVSAAQGASPVTGGVAGAALPVAGRLGRAIGNKVPLFRGVGRTQNPVEASAVAFGEARGVPIDAATATGRQILRNTQKRVSANVGGSGVAEGVQDAQSAALSRVGGEIERSVHPTSRSPVAAGEGVTKALTDLRTKYNTQADRAYARLRAMEEAATPTNVPMKQSGRLGGQPVTVTTAQPMKMAVDVRPAKAAMKTTYEQLKREAELVPLQGDKARALVALDRLITGPNFAPLSIADAARGELLAMGRTKDGVLLTAGKGVISATAKQLDTRILAAARQAGPDAVAALREGRKATVEKFRTSLVGEKIAGKAMDREPRAVFTALTADGDGSIARLRQVAKQTPTELPKIGRAWLEEALTRARSKGKFDHADALLADWLRLGPETKKLLFPTQTADLDNFFRLAAKIKENANPSGTAQVLSANLANPKHWLGGIPNYLLAKLLYEPGGVQRVINGVRPPMSLKTADMLGRVGVGGVAQTSKPATSVR